MSVHFVSQLRAPRETLRLAPTNAATVWTIRVQVAEAWDLVRMEVTPETAVGAAKQAALDLLMPDSSSAEAYEIKHRGVLVDDGDSLERAGVVDGSTLLVVSRRKRPVR
jgi:hypothetical protein